MTAGRQFLFAALPAAPPTMQTGSSFRLAPLATAASAGAQEYFCMACANPSAKAPKNCKRL
jgi:hypothetical protein